MNGLPRAARANQPSRAGLRPLLLLIGLVLQAGSGFAQSNPCFKAPRQISAPLQGLVYRSDLAAPSIQAPATIDFQSPEQFLLGITRSAIGGAGKRSAKSAAVGIHIFLKDPESGHYKLHCEVSRFALDEPFRDARFFVYSSEAHIREWRIQIVDHGATPAPSEGKQDPLNVQVIRFPADAAATDAYGARTQSGSLQLQCENFFARIQQFRPLGAAREELVLGPTLRSRTYYVRTTGPVQVAFQTDVAKLPQRAFPDGSVRTALMTLPHVSVSVKEEGPDPYAVGCQENPGLVGQALEATQFTLSRSFQAVAPPLWRIDITAPKDMAYETQAILRYPQSDAATQSFPTEFQCTPANTARTMAVRASNKVFASATMLHIALTDPQNVLPPGARAQIANHVLLGMALWRPICYLCTDDQLALAKVDDTTYILESLQNALDDHYQQRRPTLPVAAVQPQSPRILGGEYDQLLAVLGARHQARGLASNSGYQELAAHSVGVQGLCADSYDQLPLGLQRVRRALECVNDRDLPEVPVLRASARLAFLTGPLEGCPSGVDTVACESSALKIEFNAKDYRFVSHPDRQFIAGKGRRQADLLHVLAHEIGHWIGIGHLSQRGSLMNEAMSESRCIDAAATNALNVLAAGGAFPVTQAQALFWEPASAP